MKFLDLFNNKNKEETRSIDAYSINPQVINFLPIDGSNYAMFVSSVFRAVELISDSIAMLPIQVVSKEKESQKIKHDLDYIFENQLFGLTRFNFFKTLVENVLLYGNGYAYIIRKEGKITGIRLLPPETVTPNRAQNSTIISYYVCSMFQNRIMPEDMIHFVRHTDKTLNGKSNLYFASRSTNIASAVENLAQNTYKEGGVLKGIVNVEGQVNKSQKEDIKQNWRQSFDGSLNCRSEIAVLQGNMKFQPVQASALETQLLQNRQYSTQDIARFFGISPVLLGDLTHSSWGSLEVAQQEFLLHCLQPWVIMIEEELTRKLLNINERETLKINLDEKILIKSDKQALATYYTAMLNNGVLSINEVREQMGMEKVEGGDKHIIPYTAVNQNIIDNKELEIQEDGNKKD